MVYRPPRPGPTGDGRYQRLAWTLVGALVASAPWGVAALLEDRAEGQSIEQDTQKAADRVARDWNALTAEGVHDITFLQAFWTQRDRLGDVEFRNLTATLVDNSQALRRVDGVNASGVIQWGVPPSLNVGQPMPDMGFFLPLLQRVNETGDVVVSPPVLLKDGSVGFAVAARLTADPTEGVAYVVALVNAAHIFVDAPENATGFAYRVVPLEGEPLQIGTADPCAPVAHARLDTVPAQRNESTVVEAMASTISTSTLMGLPAGFMLMGVLFALGGGAAGYRGAWLLQDKHRARVGLVRSESHHRALFELAGEMIFVLDSEGRFHDANPKTSMVLGRSLRELKALKIAEVLAEESREKVQRAVATTARSGESRIRMDFVAPGGNRISTYGTLTRQGGDDEDERFIVQAHLADVTRLRVLERELVSANTALQEKVNELDAFAHTVAHDLKTPLRAVASLAEFIEEDVGAALPEESRRNLTELTAAAARMKRLVDAMLLYARSGSEHYPVERADVGAVAQEAADDLKSIIQARRARVAILPGFPELALHRIPMRQVFYNLIKNALDHNPSETPEVVVSAHPGPKDMWEFLVHDNGPGIPEEAKDRIFDLFSREDRDTSGSGIGLSIVRRVVGQHLGNVWVENDPEGGATFHFTVGRLADAAAGEDIEAGESVVAQ